jgi:hypothetical protein
VLSGNTPVAVIDFNQGWLKKNRDRTFKFLSKKPYLIRTHDPLKKEWKEIRQKSIKRGIWFSPVQDMADGSLWFPGNWESLRERVLDYLKSDDTLWKRNKWLQDVVIQISFDGALVVGPELSGKGKLLIFKGDQPESFSRLDYGQVVAGGIVFVYSLVNNLLKKESLIKCVKEGLARIRKVVIEGYVGPRTGEVDWKAPTDSNLPVEILSSVNTDEIITYAKPPEPDWDTACDIVCGDEKTLREKTVLKLGNLITSCPEYAQTLLRLASRLKNHVSNENEVLSFSIFGGPGSGKSFVAKQLAKAVDPRVSKFKRDTFNLSQFNDASRLVEAFKKIQTIGLQGKIPFILWDEFDTFHNNAQGGWLSSFLMPMQDAKFFDGMTKQALGKCIFVFIGGTFENEKKFSEWTVGEYGRKQKGTDFHSRLDSSLEVPAVDLGKDGKKHKKADRKNSKKYSLNDVINKPNPAKLVRAVMIRTFLRDQKKLKSISPEVLAFLLHVPLQHGVRSLEKIISASELSKTLDFQMYHLPPLDVLQLHVDESKITTQSIAKFINDASLESHNLSLRELEWRK